MTPTSRQNPLEELRRHLSTLLAEGQTDEALETAMLALAQLQAKNAELVLELAKLRQAGRKSEKLDAAQLSILLELCGESEDDDAEAAGDGDDAAEDRGESDTAEVTAAPRRPRRKRPPKDLPRVVIEHTLSAEERCCPNCQDAMGAIGYEMSEILELVPAFFRVEEHRRFKYACGRCKEGVTIAAGPAKLIEKGLAGPALLAHLVHSKFEDHMPLHRLSRIYGRGGADLAVSTLSDWVAAVAEELRPLVDRLWERVLGSHVLQTDASGLAVLDRDHPDGIRKGTVWCHVGDGRDVVFRYAETGTGEEGPWTHLAGRTGYIQADAATVFDRIFNGKKGTAIEVGCLAHARRKLFALKDTDPRVAYGLELFGKVYRVEKEADAKGMTPEERRGLRERKTRAILDRYRKWLTRMVAQEPPASAFHKACAYSLKHWTALTRFLEDGRLKPDNNDCERQIRSLAVGRKNYLFAGSDAGAERAAILYSILRTCALHGVDGFVYLTDVLGKLAARWPHSRIDELLPGNWHPAEAAPEPTQEVELAPAS